MNTPTRQCIAAILGIAPEDVTPDMDFDHGIGSTETGAHSSTWPRVRVAPAVAVTGGYTIATGEEWPRAAPSLLTEGSGGGE